MILNLPNTLTLGRIIVIPLIIMLYYLPEGWLDDYWVNVCATTLFVLAAITDGLDGYLARRNQQTSAFGSFLDPVADKLIVVTALLLLIKLGRLDAWIAIIIIGREVAVSALREWMALQGSSYHVSVSSLGKLKTIIQMVAIPFLLFDNKVFFFMSGYWGVWLMYIAAFLTLWSGLVYLKAAWPKIAS